MNKKFSTLLASAMLMTAFSAGAQKKGEAAMLKFGPDVLSVENSTSGATFAQLQGVAAPTDLAGLNKATWTISDVKTVLGKKVYTFVNKATGLPFSVDGSLAVAKSETAGNPLTIGAGNVSEWVNEEGKLVSYFKGDSVYFLAKNATGNSLFLKKGVVSDAATAFDFDQEFRSYQSMPLTAEDLNTLLQSDANSKSFSLTMTPEVSKGQLNVLTATALTAEDVANNTGYVNLKKAKDAYVVVDTAYYGGTESDHLLKYTYDKLGADGREAGSYNFKFTFNAAKQELYVQVAKVVYEYVANSDATADQKAAAKTALADKFWSASTDVVAGYTHRAPSTDEYIYMAKLAGTNVLTVNALKDAEGNGTRKDPKEAANQNVVIKLGTNFSGLTMTTIPDGVYTITYNAQKGNDNFEKDGAYALDNLAGNFGWAFQAKRQNFNHMPAAQWVVEKQGTTDIAPVKITNREFLNGLEQGIIEFDHVAGQPVAAPVAARQFYAVEGDASKVFYFNGSQKDTLTFTKVADELVKDNKLGYKYVNEDDAKVQTYSFNYLHGLSLDKFLYTPAGKDSIVRVDENDGKSAFRLELVVKDDHYGIGDSLVRNVYYVYNTVNGHKRYISFDGENKKYMMKKNPTPYFLKENNCIDGNHYYTLVEANFRWNLVDKNNQPVVADASKVDLYEQNCDAEGAWDPTLKKEGDVRFTSDYASHKVSVNDNTLDLEQGSINDKFNGYSEIRTSAFAVEVYDVPLYRRFNNENLGESATDAVDTLSFYENVRNEYLMDEWNKNLADTVVDYAGIWTADKAEGKLNFIVDTAWVNRGLGYIKPQYLISVARNDQDSIAGIPCTYEHNHYDNAGNKVDAAHCSHATQGRPGFRYGKYLVSFADSADINGAKKPYMDVENGYTRVGFVKAIHFGDSLYILAQGFENVEPAKLNVDEIIKAYTKAGVNELYIKNLKGDQHKNVTWSFRYVTPSVEARTTAEEGAVNSFLFESNIYNEFGYRHTGANIPAGERLGVGSIAPEHAAWLKMQNGCLVLTRGDSKFASAKTGADGALVFNVGQKKEAEDLVTDNEEVAVEGVQVVAGNGVVTVLGAAGETVTVSNILGQTLAQQVLTSDNAAIAVPAGVVVVKVADKAVKVVVK